MAGLAHVETFRGLSVESFAFPSVQKQSPLCGGIWPYLADAHPRGPGEPGSERKIDAAGTHGCSDAHGRREHHRPLEKHHRGPCPCGGAAQRSRGEGSAAAAASGGVTHQPMSCPPCSPPSVSRSDECDVSNFHTANFHAVCVEVSLISSMKSSTESTDNKIKAHALTQVLSGTHLGPVLCTPRRMFLLPRRARWASGQRQGQDKEAIQSHPPRRFE